MNAAVAVIWWVMLAATALVIAPILVSLLARAVRAARNIEQYTAEALAGGLAIGENTANIATLKETIAAAPHLVAAAESIERSTAAIEAALAAQRPGNGRVGTEEGTPWRPS